MQATSQQRYMGSVGAHQAHHYTQGGDAFLHFPAEYQAPQNAQMSGRMHAPPGMSMHPDSQQQAYNSTPMPRPPGPASQAQQPQQPYYSQEAVRPFQAVQPQTTTPDASYSLQKPLQSLSVNAGHPNFVLEEDDDELPPPPPVLSSHTMGLAGASSAGLLSTSTAPHPTEETMQYLPSGAGGAPPMAGSLTVASFGAAAKGPGVDMEGAIPSIDGVEGSQEEAGDNQISNLLMEIQSGIKLKKVQRQVELAEAKAALQESNDVAAILRRRMEHVLGNDDGSSGSGHSNEDDGEWD
uniref:WH2 domain-containing protein n=1 Tax=Ditylenchus dipsaci TaxID=166011 RepID=A0A915EJR3_9BILA